MPESDSARVLVVALVDGGVERFSEWSRWCTDEELAVYDQEGELVAVFAPGVWVSAKVVAGGDDQD